MSAKLRLIRGQIVRELAAGVDERNQQRAAMKLAQANRPVALVQQLEIGNRVSGLRHVVLHGWLVVGLGLRDDDDLIDDDVVDAVGVLSDDKSSGDAIAGVKLAADRWVLQPVGHGHRFHQAGDCVVVQHHVRPVHRDDLRPYWVRPGCGG